MGNRTKYSPVGSGTGAELDKKWNFPIKKGRSEILLAEMSKIEKNPTLGGEGVLWKSRKSLTFFPVHYSHMMSG